MPRLEKLLQRPQCATVGSALTQLLLDWAYLFKWVWTGGVGEDCTHLFRRVWAEVWTVGWV